MTIRVLLVDDSPFVRAVLRAGLARCPDIEIVGEAGDGERAVAAVTALSPDVVTMDVIMPLVDGLEAVRTIMARQPTPIVMLSDAYTDRRLQAVDALEAGAVDVMPKPEHGFDERAVHELAERLRAAASLGQVVPFFAHPPAGPAPHQEERVAHAHDRGRLAPAFVGIVASTGGPQTLRQMFQDLAVERMPPIALVQHIAGGFDAAFASWLDRCTEFHVCLAHDGMRIEAGTIAVAPNDVHLDILPGGLARLHRDELVGIHCPSGDVLFRSLAASFGRLAAAVVLTGMGDDGAQGARAVEDRGGAVLIQAPETATLPGMPRAAIAHTRTPVVAPAARLARMLERRSKPS